MQPLTLKQKIGLVFLALAGIAFLIENCYFGWNFLPLTTAEGVTDTWIAFCIGLGIGLGCEGRRYVPTS